MKMYLKISDWNVFIKANHPNYSTFKIINKLIDNKLYFKMFCLDKWFTGEEMEDEIDIILNSYEDIKESWDKFIEENELIEEDC